MKRWQRWAMFFILSVLLSSAASGPAYSGGKMTDLTPEHYDNSYAMGINASGQIVGSYWGIDGNRAFLYSEGTMTDLGTLGGPEADAYAINDSGQIVGGATTASMWHAFLYSNGVMEDLGTLGGTFSQARGINNKGKIVGRSYNASGQMRAFLYSNGVMTDLGTLGGTSEAYGINDNGQIVGGSINASGQKRAFLYSNGVMEDLGTLGGTYSEAKGINNKGQIVGRSHNASGQMRAFLYSNGVMTDLGILGGIYSEAWDINESGQIVGWSTFKPTTTGYEVHAFLYSEGTMTDLGTLGGEDSSAFGINDRCQIVGSSETASNVFRDSHAFIIDFTTPVILIHGWRGSPETWSTLKDRLDGEKWNYIIFDYADALGNPKQYAEDLKTWIEQYRNDFNYDGKFDIVCHSMGAMVSRWYMEKLDGAKNIRQWIGIAPVNHGGPLADDSKLIPYINIAFWFIPGYIIGSEPAVQAMKTRSDFLADLNYGKSSFDLADWMTAVENLAPGVSYHILVGGNKNLQSGFFPLTNGRTRNIRKLANGELSGYYWSRIGDSLVPVSLSKLKNVKVDYFEGRQHSTITNDIEVINRVIEYFKDPLAESWDNDPPEDPAKDFKSSFSAGIIGFITILLP